MNVRLAKPLIFLLPALFFHLAVIVYPSIYTLYLSFFSWNGSINTAKVFVGLQNYVTLFTGDSVFYTALRNNFLWTTGSLVATTVLGLSLAMIINYKLRGMIIFRGVFYFPYVLSGIVVSLMWSWMYHPEFGVFNEILRGIGFEPVEWLSNPKLALLSVFIASTWHHVGAPMILFLAGLQSIPSDPYEAAKVEGANKLQVFIYVTVPMLRETFVIVFATTLIGSMKVFDTIYAMTGGGPAQSTQVLASWMYYQTFQFHNLGVGSAISWILVILVMAITIPYIMHMSKQSHV
ncbi:carbohydrate ABC transporter permease [Paenibacillus piri]|uniref:Sugar ABC transporter permease n=1 Tax=Paenibacillus piri TaxID=2547395 RepID=A0A4R5KWZ1_9BACL|nr:sugar ABC transporter permease [Paenibacillus piri]TDF99500.1 sugar ABC transporter permease [Paenibacillus piri]